MTARRFLRYGQANRRNPKYVRDVGGESLPGDRAPAWLVRGHGERRTHMDFAHCVKELVVVQYPEAERVVLALDQLNIHSPASLYATFPPHEAKRPRVLDH